MPASARPTIAAGVGDGALRAAVAGVDELEHALERHRLAAAALEQFGDGDRAGDGLQTAAVAAAADQPVLDHARVPDLAGNPGDAAVEAAADDQPDADPGREAQVDDVAAAATGAEDVLAHGAGVGVVLDQDGHPEPVLELLGRPDPIPAGQDPFAADDAVRRSDGGGEPDADADDPSAVGLRVGERVLDELLREIESRSRRFVDALLPAAGEDLTREIADRGADVPVTEVESDRERRAWRERDVQRRTAHRAWRIRRTVGLLLDDPSVLELGQERSDGSPRQEEGAAELAAAAGRLPQKRFQQAKAVGLTRAATHGVVHPTPEDKRLTGRVTN